MLVSTVAHQPQKGNSYFEFQVDVYFTTQYLSTQALRLLNLQAGNGNRKSFCTSQISGWSQCSLAYWFLSFPQSKGDWILLLHLQHFETSLALKGLLNNLAWKSTGGHLSTICPKVKLTINPASISPHIAFCLLRPQIFNLLNYFSYILKYLQRLD